MYSPITDMLVTVKDYSNLGEDAIPTKHNVLLKDIVLDGFRDVNRIFRAEERRPSSAIPFIFMRCVKYWLLIFFSLDHSRSREFDIAAPAVQARWEFTQNMTTSLERDIDRRIELASHRAFIAQKGSLHESHDPWGRFTVHRIACGAQVYFCCESGECRTILEHPRQIATTGGQLYVSSSQSIACSANNSYFITQLRSQRAIAHCVYALGHHGQRMSWPGRDDPWNRIPTVLDLNVLPTLEIRFRSSCSVIGLSSPEHILATTLGGRRARLC